MTGSPAWSCATRSRGRKAPCRWTACLSPSGAGPRPLCSAGSLETDEAGYLIADETTRTSLPGVYAVGDVRRKPVRQILTAAADGAVAAHYIEEYLAGNRA